MLDRTVNRLLLVACVVCAGVPAWGTEAVYATIKAAQYNEVWKTQFPSDLVIRYEDESNQLTFYSNETLSVFGFALVRAEADSLAARIAKYQKWNRQASDKGVTLEKQIGTVRASLSAWKMGDEWSFGPNFSFDVHFFSQSPQVHQMVLIFPKLTSHTNEYDTHKAETLYIGWDSAQELARLLQPGAIEAWLARQKEQEAIEAEFK